MVKDPGKITKLQGGKDQASQINEERKPTTHDHKTSDHKKQETPKPAPKKEK